MWAECVKRERETETERQTERGRERERHTGPLPQKGVEREPCFSSAVKHFCSLWHASFSLRSSSEAPGGAIFAPDGSCCCIFPGLVGMGL